MEARTSVRIGCDRLLPHRRAVSTWFVLHELLGYPSVENCDSSWTEYGSLVGVPVERLTSTGSVAVLRTEDLPHRSQAALTTAYRSITAQMARPQRPALPDALREIRLHAGEATRSPIRCAGRVGCPPG
jgi:hypothetical protein